MGCLKNIFLIIGILIVIGIFKSCIAVFEDTPTVAPVPVSQTTQQQAPVTNTKPQEIKRLSIEEQYKDKKGVALPTNDRLKITVNNIELEQLYFHPEFNIEAYYVNLNKYPQIANNILNFSENLANNLSENSPISPIDVDAYIYSSPIDFYYLRKFSQTTPKEIILELEKQRPILHITYRPNILLNICVLAPEGYKLVGKTKYNGWVWEQGGLNNCGYEHTKKIAAY